MTGIGENAKLRTDLGQERARAERLNARCAWLMTQAELMRSALDDLNKSAKAYVEQPDDVERAMLNASTMRADFLLDPEQHANPSDLDA